MSSKNLKKAVASAVIILMPLGVLTACDSKTDKRGDKSPIISCDHSRYKAAGRVAKTAKGTFFVCGGKKCVITVTYQGTKKVITRKSPGEFEVDRRARSWNAKGCGTVYKRK